MLNLIKSAVMRRNLFGIAMLGAALTACAAQAAAFTMYRDPNCGCCLEWADHIRNDDVHEVVTIKRTDMGVVKAEHGVPADLASCHTMIADGYVIEGHVPRADIERLLRERPEGVAGLAVPGMPIGSPGMEMGNRQQPFQVIAFGPAGRSVWASYPARSQGNGIDGNR